MTILRIIPYLNIPELGITDNSGFTQTVQEINETQVSLGNKVVLLSNYRGEFEKNNIKVLNPFKFIFNLKLLFNSILDIIKYRDLINNLDSGKSISKIFLSFFYANGLIIIKRKYGVNAFHIHSFHDNVIPYILKLIDKNVYFVLTLHFIYPLEHKKYSFLIRKLEKANCTLTTISSTFYKVLSLKLNKSSIYNIPNGINLERIENHCVNMDFSFSSDKQYILFAGSIVDRKNLIFLIKLMPFLDEKIHLIVCGDGPLLPLIKQMTSKTKLLHRVHFRGRVDYSKMPFYYKKVDCVCVVSKSEAFGRMFLEAAALGTPSLCFEDLGAVQTLKSIRGFYTCKRDLVEYKEKLNYILSKDIDKRLIKESVKEFDWKIICEKYQDLYTVA